MTTINSAGMKWCTGIEYLTRKRFPYFAQLDTTYGLPHTFTQTVCCGTQYPKNVKA